MKSIYITLQKYSKLLAVSCFLLFSFSVFAGKFIVVIDAGHGGKDPGAIGRTLRLKEKDINLDIALALGGLIKENYADVEVIFTRKTDVFVDLVKRADIANKAKANLFISVHTNAAPNRQAKGTEVYTLGLSNSERNLEVAKRENSVILLENDYKSRYEGFDPNSTESYIIFQMMQNKYTEQSVEFADDIQKQFCGETSKSAYGVRQAGFLVLRNTGMPSVLVEVGYISNKEEEKYLSCKENREELANSIFCAFKKYKKTFDRYQVNNIQKETPKGQFKGDKEQSPLIYKIELLTSKKKLPTNAKEFKGLDPVMCYFDGHTYHYTFRYTSSYQRISEEFEQVKNKFETARIVHFRDGKMLD